MCITCMQLDDAQVRRTKKGEGLRYPRIGTPSHSSASERYRKYGAQGRQNGVGLPPLE